MEHSFFSPVIRMATAVVGRYLLRGLRNNARQAQQLNRQTLHKIIEMNQHTVFGQAHNFPALVGNSLETSGYKTAVPLSKYDDYLDLIERIKKGEENILFAEPITNFAFTAGTTGPQKLIPTTRRHQRFLTLLAGFITPAIASEQVLQSVRMGRGICLLSTAGKVEHTEGGIPLGVASTMSLRRINRLIPHIWSSPAAAFDVGDDTSLHYVHALFGLRDSEAEYIISAFASHVTQWLKVLEARWPELVQDIEQGTLSANLNISADLRRRLEANLTSSPQRAAELRQAAALGFAGIAKRIWPHLAYVNAISTGSFAIYVPQMRVYVGDIPIFGPVYASSEATMGAGIWADKPSNYLLMSGANYFEFIPLTAVEEEQPETLDIEALVVGEAYELVITNFAGLYRYRTGDVVVVTEYFHQAPVFNFSHRMGTFLNLAAEKVTEIQVQAAMSQLYQQWLGQDGRCLRDYTIAVDTSINPPYYQFYLEFLDGTVTTTAVATLDNGHDILDKALSQENHLYADRRKHNYVGQPQINVLAAGSFDQFHQALLARSDGQNRNQLKIPRYLKNPDHIALLEQRVAS